MGRKFAGHAFPGSFFILFGTWWTFAVWRNYIRSRQNKQPYVCHCTYAVPCLPRKISVEGIVKVISSCACIAVEYHVAFGRGPRVLAESVTHQSMILFFLLNGVVDLMYNAGFPFPPNTDYVVLLLACASEGQLFHSHLVGSPELNVIVHTLLVYSMVAMVVCIAAEMCQPRSVLLSLGRAYFCLLHGTWLWQIAFILHNPLPGYKPWDVNSHKDSMLAASIFSWHMMVLVVYVGTLGAVAWAVNRTCGSRCEDIASEDAEEDGALCEALIRRGM
ncbi:transmembrane protein 45B-like [Rhipicephalus sanguineus]|uniref:transmembrane protein 45B-like n=1 Tax=Rhipicephalus sanguineus TaxID=34632 RepID=UPI0018959007|nr:transmembrane protein 45B-like [Rhipicephalus sanguineus]